MPNLPLLLPLVHPDLLSRETPAVNNLRQFFTFLRPQRYLVRAAALAYLVGAVPHLVYHANHLDLYDTGDQVANLIALGATAVLPAILLLATARGVPDRASNEAGDERRVR